jgi:hypothetical protein
MDPLNGIGLGLVASMMMLAKVAISYPYMPLAKVAISYTHCFFNKQ